MSERTRRLPRRSFLFAVGAGGAITAAAMVAKNLPKEQAAAGDDDKRATRGYHSSQHVDAYYRTVKI